MEKILKKLSAMAMIAIAALFITASFTSCMDDDDDTTSTSSSDKPAVATGAMIAYYFNFTTDMLKVADVTFTYTDSLGKEQVEQFKINSPNERVQQILRKVHQPKLPATFVYKLTIKMKDKKDIPVQSIYQLGWNDTFTSVAPIDNTNTLMINYMKMLMQSPFNTSSDNCKKVTYDELEDAFKNSVTGFENVGLDKTTVTVSGTNIKVER